MELRAELYDQNEVAMEQRARNWSRRACVALPVQVFKVLRICAIARSTCWIPGACCPRSPSSGSFRNRDTSMVFETNRKASLANCFRWIGISGNGAAYSFSAIIF